MAQKSGVIDVGGGMRGIYAAGVLDRCLDDGVQFDVALGISAGSANISSYMSKQRGRNYRFYTDYSFRKDYMSWQNLVRKGTFFDMDYIYGTLSEEDGEDPVDYDALESTPTDWRIIACNANTGETKYFDKSSMSRNNYDILKASSAIPLVCHPYEVEGEIYFDGALGDTIPIEKAFEMGCTKVVLILTKPADVLRAIGNDAKIARLIKHRYPAASLRMLTRAERYNEGVALAKALEEDGLVLIVAPDDTCGVDTIAKDRVALDRLYEKGYNDGAKIKEFLES